jgi:hypothetical protein
VPRKKLKTRAGSNAIVKSFTKPHPREDRIRKPPK